MPRSSLPLLALVVAVLIWASNNIVSKVLLREASPALVATVRFTLAGLLFFLPAFLALHRGERRFARADWVRLAALGSLGVTGGQVLLLLGLRSTPATDASVYQLASPLFLVALAWACFGERPDRCRALGVAAAFLGAAVLVAGSAAGFGGGDPLGAALVLLGSLAYSSQTLLRKDLLARPPLLVLAATSLVAMAAIWPTGGLLGAWAELPRVRGWSAAAWLAMAHQVVLMSVASQWLFIRALRDLRASQISAVLYAQPLFTACMAAVILGESPSGPTLLSGALILAGLWLANRPIPRRGDASLTTGDPNTRGSVASGKT
jgi:drug/metabolite transporter (DMT)-like permease